MDKKLVDPAMAAIRSTFGYGMSGTHLKKCEICGESFEEPNDLELLIVHGPYECPKCKEIIELRKVITDHWNKFHELEADNPIEEKNLIQNPEVIHDEYGTTTTYTLDDFKEEIIVKRSHKVEEIISIIEAGRNFLYFQIGAQMEILSSIYERKDRFWNDGGNLKVYVRDALLQSVVIKLREYLGDKAKISLSKIRNRINEKKREIYQEQHVTVRKTFKKSGDVMETTYPAFPIDSYLDKLDGVLNSYKKIVQALIDYRDNLFAHMGKLKDEESKDYLTYTNIKRIHESLKIIYSGLLYSVAPEKSIGIYVKHPIFFDHLNNISEYWANNHKRE